MPKPRRIRRRPPLDATGGDPSPSGGAVEPVGRDFRLLLAATLAAFANYASMLAVVPSWAADAGAGHSGVGATTGVTMAGTVAIQCCMVPLLRRLTLRSLLIIGGLLLSLPTVLYPLSPTLEWMLAVSVVRGVGFGIVAVAGSALVAELVPPHRRGRAVGSYGVAVGIPSVLFLPGGVWAAEQIGFVPVFLAAGLLSLLAVPLVALMGRAPAAPPVATEGGSGGASGDLSPRASAGYRPLAAPWVLLITAACALGGAASFLPLLLERPTSAAPLALFVLSVATVAGRWLAGVRGDRHGVGGLLPAAVAAAAVGMAGFALAATGDGQVLAVATVSAAVYGLGFGALQNDTLVVMFHRAGPGRHGVASTAWNMAYDAGAGAGSFAVGLLAHALGLRGAFLASACVIAMVVPVAWRQVPRRGGARARRSASRPTRPSVAAAPAGSLIAAPPSAPPPAATRGGESLRGDGAHPPRAAGAPPRGQTRRSSPDG